MLELKEVRLVLDQVNAKSTNKIYVLTYFQRDFKHILSKLDFRQLLLINGSWYQGFHLKPEYYTLVNRKIPYRMITPFTDEEEARLVADSLQPPAPALPEKLVSDAEMLSLANRAAKGSFDYSSFQTGCALGQKHKDGYRAIATFFNRVVPYQTYPMHHGAIREKMFSPPNDLNFYDTNHYEVELMVEARHTGLDLNGTSIFVNVMHCPTCARMLSRTGIQEFVYAQDHSDGYAINLLELAGKKVRRLL